ncbi:ArsR/SmtB family transcription factor [Frigoribacterium sp. 2-23]|uniref:ArsR/SmtB family transcription factor n=1 Tax=Frigoribacterium sp. 2-23 TaxID=3415006 RepID=UPI003C6FD354
MPDIFAVIADGTRRDLLKVLLDRRLGAAPATASTTGAGPGEISVGEIVTELGLSQPTVSKHLRVLRDAGLVHVREVGQHRYYGIELAPLDVVDDWLLPFTSVDALESEPTLDPAATAVFAAWAGVAVPAPIRRAAASLPEAEDVASTLGRAVADAQHRASSALHDAQSALDERVIDPVLKRLGRKD